MGYIKHNAIIVTGMGEQFDFAYEKAKSLFGELVTEVIPSINNSKSFFVATSGSKQGWDDFNKHHESRIALANFIDSLKFDDGSNVVQFIDVAYNEDHETWVERTNEKCLSEPISMRIKVERSISLNME